MSANVLFALNSLHLHRPGADAAPGVVAAWYRRKALVLDEFASQGSAVAGVQARIARDHARTLTATTKGPRHDQH